MAKTMGVARLRWSATAKPVCRVLAASWRAPLPCCKPELDVAARFALGHTLLASATKWPSNAKSVTVANIGNSRFAPVRRRKGLAMLNMVESLFEQGSHMVVVETVEHLAAILPRSDQPHLSQAAHVMRYG